MDIPLFVPSTSLLASWQLKYRVMDERTWSGVFKVTSASFPFQLSQLVLVDTQLCLMNCFLQKFRRDSSIGKHFDSEIEFDPNNEFDLVNF